MGGSWAQTAKLTAPDSGTNDHLGISVAVSGGRVVAGRPNDDDLGPNAGAADVFERGEDGVWRHAAKLLAEDGEARDRFGQSVAVDGDRIIVSADHDDDNGEDAGSAYVFERDDDGAWIQTAKLVAPRGNFGQWFGFDVALQGRGAIIGTPRDDRNGHLAGAVYVYELLNEGGWSFQTNITPADAEPDDNFGIAVAVSGDTVVVGARDNEKDVTGPGAAYVFDLAPLTPDLDGDEDVDLDDYALFASCITGPDGTVRVICEPADLDCDQDVDLTDYTRFQSAIP
jgi:hypothetical protein